MLLVSQQVISRNDYYVRAKKLIVDSIRQYYTWKYLQLIRDFILNLITLDKKLYTDFLPFPITHFPNQGNRQRMMYPI